MIHISIDKTFRDEFNEIRKYLTTEGTLSKFMIIATIEKINRDRKEDFARWKARHEP